MRTLPLARWTRRVEPRFSLLPLPLLGLYLLALPLLLWRLDSAPAFWFDEGFRANQAYVLATTGQYATSDHDAVRPFDPAAGTGPADTLPVAALYALLGPGIWQSRLPTVVYALLGLTAAYFLGRWFAGWQAGFLAALLVLAAPIVGDTGYVMLGRQLMGEVPAVALILLGLWLWFQIWEADRPMPALWRAALPGLVVGLGLLSKTQTAFGVLPGLALITAARCWTLRRQGRATLIREVAPLLAVAAMLGSWQFLTRIAVDDIRRVEYAAMLSVTVGTNLLTSLFGRATSNSAWAMFGLMVMVAALAGIAAARHGGSRWSARTWGQLTLALIVLSHALWFAYVSIGWTRYAFLGWVTAWLLLGVGATRLLRQPEVGPWPWRIAAVALAALAFLYNGYRIVATARDSQVVAAAAFIRQQIPAEAVIESWEWELDALALRTDISRPGQTDQMDAIRRVFYPTGGPAPTYDTLRNDPDYLIVGRMAGFTGVYPPDVIADHFVLLVEIGDYDIYSRVR